MAAEGRLTFARACTHAEEYAGLDAAQREEAVQDGRAFPAGRREDEEVRGEHEVEKPCEPRLRLDGVTYAPAHARPRRDNRERAGQRKYFDEHGQGRDPRGHARRDERRARLAQREPRGPRREPRDSQKLSSFNSHGGVTGLLIYPNSAEARERAGRTVAAGGCVAFRTDTFYGLGVNPFDRRAVEALNELKGREGKPVLVLVSDAEAADKLLAERSELFDFLAARHWPGPLTLIGRAAEGVPELLTAGTGTVGVRLPDDEEAREIVRACGGALTATSANPAGRPPACTAVEVASYFAPGPLFVIDGGECRTELPSTVLDVSGGRPRLIREGVVARARLEESLRLLGRSLA